MGAIQNINNLKIDITNLMNTISNKLRGANKNLMIYFRILYQSSISRIIIMLLKKQLKTKSILFSRKNNEIH